MLGGGCPGPPRVTPLAPSRVCAPLPVPRGPDDGGTSLSVCWAQLPRALAWQAGSAGLGGREPAWPRGPLGAGAAHWPRAILTVRRTQGASCSGTRRLSRPLSGSCDLALLFLKKKCGSVSRPPRVSWRPWLFSPRTTEAFSLDKKSRNSSMCVPPGKSTLDGAEPASFLKANVSVEVSGPAGLDGSAHPHPGRRRASRLPHPPPHGQVHVGLSLVLVGPSRGTFWRSWGGNSCPWQIRALNMFSQECFPCNIDSRAERAAACGRGPSRASAR